jgi:hypothetical protein
VALGSGRIEGGVMGMKKQGVSLISKKQGIMYSLVMFMLLSVVLTLISTGSYFILSDDEFTNRKLITDQLSRFENNVRGDISKAIDVSARRAMVASINYILTTGDTLDDSVVRIKELMQNGTLFGNPQELMVDNTLSDWLDKMMEQGEHSGFEVVMDYTNFDVELVDSFTVQFNISVLLNTSDIFNTMNLTETIQKSVDVSIERFEDPVFPLNSIGRITRVIYRAPFSNFSTQVTEGTSASGTTKNTTIIADSSDAAYISSIPNKNSKILVTDNASNVASATLAQFSGVIAETTDSPSASIPYIIGATNAMTTVPNNTRIYMDEATMKAWDFNNLEQTVNLSYYVPSENGPSFFDRLEGRLTNTYTYGIESFVDLQELSDFELNIYPWKTTTDFLYFSNISYPGHTIRGFYYEWFTIDDEPFDGTTRAEWYGVDELIS